MIFHGKMQKSATSEIAWSCSCIKTTIALSVIANNSRRRDRPTKNDGRYQRQRNDSLVLHHRVLSVEHVNDVRQSTAAKHQAHHIGTSRMFDKPRNQTIRFTYKKQRQPWHQILYADISKCYAKRKLSRSNSSLSRMNWFDQCVVDNLNRLCYTTRGCNINA